MLVPLKTRHSARLHNIGTVRYTFFPAQWFFMYLSKNKDEVQWNNSRKSEHNK